MISVSHKFKNKKEKTIKKDVDQLVNICKTKDGFSHYRLLEMPAESKKFVLLTYWKSSTHYRQAFAA